MGILSESRQSSTALRAISLQLTAHRFPCIHSLRQRYNDGRAVVAAVGQHLKSTFAFIINAGDGECNGVKLSRRICDGQFLDAPVMHFDENHARVIHPDLRSTGHLNSTRFVERHLSHAESGMLHGLELRTVCEDFNTASVLGTLVQLRYGDAWHDDILVRRVLRSIAMIEP